MSYLLIAGFELLTVSIQCFQSNQTPTENLMLRAKERLKYQRRWLRKRLAHDGEPGKDEPQFEVVC